MPFICIVEIVEANNETFIRRYDEVINSFPVPNKSQLQNYSFMVV